MSASILVILPTYNEKENLPSLLQEIMAQALPNLEVLVVDDQSPDGTGELADKLVSTYPGLHVLHRTPPRGRGLAGRDGFAWARDHGYEMAIEMDADFSHPPRFLPELVSAMATDIDLVIGSRYIPGGRIEGWPRWRYLNSAVANRMAKWVLGLVPHDCTSGYRCFSRHALTALPWEQMITTGPAIVEEMLYHAKLAGLRYVEIPITFVEREQGVSKVTPLTILRWIRELLRIRRAARSIKR